MLLPRAPTLPGEEDVIMFLNEGGTDFGQAQETFTTTFNLSASAFRPTEKKFRWRHTAIGDATMSISRSTALARLETFGAVSDEIVICSHLSGQAIYGHGRDAVNPPLFIPHVMINGYSPSEITGIDTDANFVYLDKQLVSHVAEEIDGEYFQFSTWPQCSFLTVPYRLGDARLLWLPVSSFTNPMSSLPSCGRKCLG